MYLNALLVMFVLKKLDIYLEKGFGRDKKQYSCKLKLRDVFALWVEQKALGKER